MSGSLPGSQPTAVQRTPSSSHDTSTHASGPRDWSHRPGRPCRGRPIAACRVPVRALTRQPAAAAALPSTGTVPVLEALGRLRVRRLDRRPRVVVFLSSPHRTPHPFFRQPNPMAALHADIERLIAAAGLASTIIRPGMFASNTMNWWAASIRNGDIVRWPYGAAETAPIDVRDVAAVAVRALHEDGHAGGDYVLTGPESLSQAEQVRIIGAAIGRQIQFEELSPEEFRRETADSWPGPVVDMLLAAWAATIGLPAFVTSTVSDIVGSPPRTFRQWAIDHSDAFLKPSASDAV